MATTVATSTTAAIATTATTTRTDSGITIPPVTEGEIIGIQHNSNKQGPSISLPLQPTSSALKANNAIPLPAPPQAPLLTQQSITNLLHTHIHKISDLIQESESRVLLAFEHKLDERINMKITKDIQAFLHKNLERVIKGTLNNMLENGKLKASMDTTAKFITDGFGELIAQVLVPTFEKICRVCTHTLYIYIYIYRV